MFTPVRFEFDGVPYVIPAHRVLMAIAAVEEHLTIHELATFMARKTAPSARTAQAYAALIQFAGGEVTADRVWESMFTGDRRTKVQDALAVLLMMLTPPPGDVGNAPPVPPRPVPKGPQMPVPPAYRQGPIGKAAKRSTKR